MDIKDLRDKFERDLLSRSRSYQERQWFDFLEQLRLRTEILDRLKVNVWDEKKEKETTIKFYSEDPGEPALFNAITQFKEYRNWEYHYNKNPYSHKTNLSQVLDELMEEHVEAVWEQIVSDVYKEDKEEHQKRFRLVLNGAFDNGSRYIAINEKTGKIRFGGKQPRKGTYNVLTEADAVRVFKEVPRLRHMVTREYVEPE